MAAGRAERKLAYAAELAVEAQVLVSEAHLEDDVRAPIAEVLRRLAGAIEDAPRAAVARMTPD